MKLPVDTESTPPSENTPGGTKDHTQSPVTLRDVVMVVAAVSIAVGVTLYLNNQINGVRQEIAVNSQRLAVIETEIMGLRRDIKRLETHVAHTDPEFEMDAKADFPSAVPLGGLVPVALHD